MRPDRVDLIAARPAGLFYAGQTFRQLLPADAWRRAGRPGQRQELIRSLGLKDEDELQAWFTAELSRYLMSKGRILVGWDEILAGAELGAGEKKTALAPNAVVTSWRGEEGGLAAALAGDD